MVIINGAPMLKLPNDFVFILDIDPTIIEISRYYENENFLGHKVVGYTQPHIISTKNAAVALKAAQAKLNAQGYKLVVYDGYRPQRAVNEFIRWSKNLQDQIAKSSYYPNIDKQDVFKLGYLFEKSSHSRGSTFDLTIIPIDQTLKPIEVSKRTLANNQQILFLDDNTVDMGSSFDLFHEVSHHDTNLISEHQTKMRNILRSAMLNNGFKEYQEEWWHYTLANEPFPDTYFDFIPSQIKL